MSTLTYDLVKDGYLGADFTSKVWPIDNFPLSSFHFWMTGTPSGTLTVQVSNYDDLITDGYTGANANAFLSTYIPQWVNLHDVVNFPVANAYNAQTITSGSPSGGMLNLNLAGWRWCRVVWTHSGGTGTLQVRVKGKRLSPANQ